MSNSFVKLFASITESTVWSAEYETRIVWVTMLAMCDADGCVWASIPGLSRRANVSIDGARKAIQAFLSPDLDSRTKDHEGRRIEEIDGGWKILNYNKYREMMSAEEIRKKTAERVRRYRERHRINVTQPVTKCNVSNDIEEVEVEEEAEEESIIKRSVKLFEKPTSDMVKEYALTIGFTLDGNDFVDFYESKGWMIGKNKMKDWKAAVRTWKKNQRHNFSAQTKKLSFDNSDERRKTGAVL